MKAQTVILIATVVAAAAFIALVALFGGHAPGGIQDHYPNPTVASTR